MKAVHHTPRRFPANYALNECNRSLPRRQLMAQFLCAGIGLSLLLGAVHSRASLTFSIGNETVVAGNSVTVPISIDNSPNMMGYQFSLAWNPTVLESATAENFSLPASFGFTVNPGSLTTFWNPSDDIPKTLSGVLFTVTFNTSVSAPGGSYPIIFTDFPTGREIVMRIGGIDEDVTGSSTFNAGSVTVTAVPEPADMALGVFAALVLGTHLIRRIRRQSA